MRTQQSESVRALAEAHLYVAVAKADGLVSQRERAQTAYYARQSQKKYNFFKMNREVAETIRGFIADIFSKPDYESWNAEQHLEEGLRLLREALSHGERGVRLTGDKIEQELYEVAYMDGYDLRESRFVKHVLGELKKF